MNIQLGVTLAFVAMVLWGFGDFMIQKSTRRVGDWETLFIISLFGFVVLIPFIVHSLPALFVSGWNTSLSILVAASIVLFIAALLEFESLRRGKISIVEPSWSLEIPAAAFLSFLILREHISFLQILLVIILMSSLVLVGLRGKRLSKSLLFEKGIFLALLAGIAMGGANFLMGWGGRVADPIIVNFFTDAFLMIGSGAYLFYNGRMKRTLKDFRHSYQLLLSMSFFDKVAWLAFIFSMSFAPIAIATALSESYVIIAVLLGLFISREKLHIHQKIGLVGAVLAAVILAITASIFHPDQIIKKIPLVSSNKPNQTNQIINQYQHQKLVALTFDDGPYGTSTEAIIAILEQKKVPATFFLIGKNVELYPQQVQEEVNAGFVVGNHSYSHSKSLSTMSSSTLEKDVVHAQTLLVGASGGHVPHLFRAPYGAVSSTMVNEINHEGYVLVSWNVDPKDWDITLSSSTVEQNVVAHVTANSIILMHDGHETGTTYSRENTIEALPGIIDTLRSEGYTFVTVDKIVHTNPYVI